MIPSNVKNVLLVIQWCFYRVFNNNVDIVMPTDVTEHECVIGCLLFAVTLVLGWLMIVFLIATLIINIIL